MKIIISKGVERVSDGNPGRDRVAVTAGTARWLAIRAVMTNCLSISTCHTKISRVSRVFLSNFLPAFSALSLGRALYSRLWWLSTNNRQHGHERANETNQRIYSHTIRAYIRINVRCTALTVDWNIRRESSLIVCRRNNVFRVDPKIVERERPRFSLMVPGSKRVFSHLFEVHVVKIALKKQGVKINKKKKTYCI